MLPCTAKKSSKDFWKKKFVNQDQFVIEDVLRMQTFVDKIIRAKMIRKILETHSALKMREETLFLAVYILDRYLSKKVIKNKDVDLLLVTIIFIAAKYEETIYVKLFKILNGYKIRLEPAQVILFEADVLAVLDFKLNIICPYDFLKRIFLIQKIDDKNFSWLNSCLLLVYFRGHFILGSMSSVQEFWTSYGCLWNWHENPQKKYRPIPK